MATTDSSILTGTLSKLMQLVIAVSVIILMIAPVSGKEILAGSISIQQLISDLIENISKELSDTLDNKDEFVLAFSEFKSQTDVRLEQVFNDMSGVIKNYADSNDKMDISSEQLIENFSQISTELDGIQKQYPQLSEIRQIIDPFVLEFESVLISRFPELAASSKQGNPLSNVFQFYQSSEHLNPHGLGPFFRIEFLDKSTRLKMIDEKSLEKTVAGIKTEEILLRETNHFNNDILVYHQLIVDGEVIELTKTLEDLTLLHGLPLQLRKDGVDEKVVHLVEEYLNLINYHLKTAFNDLGLDIPADHPQLIVPPGYTPDTFVSHFVNILEDLKGEIT